MAFAKVSQLFRRRAALLSAALMRQSAACGCARAYRAIDPGSVKKIGVFLDYPAWIMLGDQFWFEPLLRGLVAQGFEVSLDCTGGMREYFASLGYAVSPKADWGGIDACVTRIDLASMCIRSLSCPVIAVDTSVEKISSPVCRAILDGVFGLLGRDPSASPSRPRMPEAGNGSGLPALPSRTVLVNDQVGSGGFRVWPKDRERLWEAVRARKAGGAAIACVGSKEERAQPLIHPELVDIDLRGEIPLIGQFRLCRSPSVEGMVCFDGFLSHLFEACGKDVDVHYRRQFTRKKRSGIRKYYHPPFDVFPA